MKKTSITLIILSIICFIGCEKVTDPNGGVNSDITTKEKLNDVLLKARLDFATDIKLSALYGWNVSLNGTVDLLKTDNAFVYVVQSNQLQSNEFYIPTLATGPNCEF